MHYHDVIYGDVTLEEAVLVDLIESVAVQRLHGVLQHGITGLIGITRPVTRFDHSMGAMLLVRRLGGSLEEQIASLLHDISHTAFSHVIDYVFEKHNSQSYHDEVKEAYVATTDLPSVLARHGYDWQMFMHEEAFSLLEQPAPRLCVDRLDYFLRDSVDLGLATRETVQQALTHLRVFEGRLVTDNRDTARWLAETYMAADEASWANFREVGLYELAARAIRRGLALQIIEEQDLWQTDAVVWQRLKQVDDPELQQLLSLVSPATRFIWDEEAPTFYVSTKLRTIDPDVLLPSGRLSPLSSLDGSFKSRRLHYLERRQGLWPMRVLSLESSRVEIENTNKNRETVDNN